MTYLIADWQVGKLTIFILASTHNSFSKLYPINMGVESLFTLWAPNGHLIDDLGQSFGNLDVFLTMLVWSGHIILLSGTVV